MQSVLCADSADVQSAYCDDTVEVPSALRGDTADVQTLYMVVMARSGVNLLSYNVCTC